MKPVHGPHDNENAPAADERGAPRRSHPGPPGGGPLAEAFDPRLFREQAGTAAAALEDHLSDLSVRGLDLMHPGTLSRLARELMTTEQETVAPFDEKKLAAIIDLYVRTGIPVHSPGYMGRQFSGVVPLAGVIDFVSSVVNQPSSFYEAGQLPNVAERIMAEELNRFIGWEPGSFAMVTTSGGSLANLTALLAARNVKFPDFWSTGSPSSDQHEGAGPAPRPAIAVGADVHYSVSRAAGIMGIGQDRIVRLPLDDRQRICMDQVRPALAAAEARNLKVFCLVASAGTTAVGAFDPIDQLADLARELDMWLHVDGSHGASLLVSDRLRHRMRGIEKADSLTWDAHKLMFVPAPCTMLFYRQKEASLEAFRQQASYVFDERPDPYTELDSGAKNFECTKRPMIMSLWTLWAMHGRGLFAEKIEYLCRQTQAAHRILLDEPDFRTLHEPESNILCFRHLPEGLADEDVHRFQVAVRDRIKLRGNFFISKVDIDGVAALRVVMMNHRITPQHFRLLLGEIRRAGRQALAEARAGGSGDSGDSPADQVNERSGQ